MRLKAENKLSSREEIKQAILRGGFPFQMEISYILSKRGYDVSNSLYFFDRDENKAREFDIETFMDCQKAGSDKLVDVDSWYFNPALLIECKKSENFSWVFFDSKPIGAWYDIGHSIDVLTTKGYASSLCTRLLTNDFVKHYRTFKHVASCRQQIKKDVKVSRTDEFFDALIKTIKFMNYEFENLRGFYEVEPIRKDIIFFFPIVVFSGDLYFASFESELKISETPHIIYETRYLSSLTGKLVPLYVDVVRKDAFAKLVSLIEKEVVEINEYMSKPEIQADFTAISSKLLKKG